jgi:uncharacterized OB-fold protein
MTTSHAARRDSQSAAWFDGLAAGYLLIKRCQRCSHFTRPDAGACPDCHSTDLEWTRAAGAGTVVCVIRDRATDEPVTLGLVELAEGPWLHVRLAGMHLSAGTPVSLSVHHAEGSEPIPLFSPTRPADTRTRMTGRRLHTLTGDTDSADHRG